MSIDWPGILNYLEHTSIKNLLHEMYYVRKMSSNQIAKKIGVSGPTILHLIKESGLEVRSKGGANNVRRVQ